MRDLGIVPHPALKAGQKHAARRVHRGARGEPEGAQAHRGDLRLDEDHRRCFRKSALSRHRAHARTGPIRRRDVESGADGKTHDERTAEIGAGVTPAGPAVCPHPAPRPEAHAGRAEIGAAAGAEPAFAAKIMKA